MKESDVQGLRNLGLSDEQILSTVGITCLFNFMNRLADGLGVDIPAERQEAMSRWVTGPAREQAWLWGEKKPGIPKMVRTLLPPQSMVSQGWEATPT